MSSSQSPEPENSTAKPPAGNGKKKPYVIILFAVILLIGGIFGVKAWQFNSVHEGTDDAQLTSDVIPVSPQVTAQVVTVLVKENQEVKAGDLIVQLDTATLLAAYNQAKANLESATSAAQEAGVAITLATETGAAQETKASGGVSQAESGIAQAKADLKKSEGAVDSAVAMKSSAQANLNLAQNALTVAQANLQRSKEAAAAAAAQVDTAMAGLGAAKGTVDAAQAAYDRAAMDSARYSTLLDEGAVSAQTADNAASAARQAKGQLENAKQLAAQAQANIAQQQANLKASNRQIEANAAAVNETRDQIAAARAQVAASSASIEQAKAQLSSTFQGIGSAEAKRTQALGDLKQARTAPVQVTETRSTHTQAIAKIAQMKAALETARIQLDDARIVAPISGRVTKKTVEPGQYVQPGTPLLTIVPDNDVWVVANFKETQLADVRVGNHVEVDVDGLPGKSFKAHVDSISSGTGATFALLPPDNATGNFTKVVQRIPVKIVFEPGQADMDRLRAGMSVVATIATK